MSFLIKLCGMTRAQDIDLANDLGADAIGLIFAPQSKRYLSVEQGATLRHRAPMGLRVFALVADASVTEVKAILDAVSPDFVQFHGNETPEFCQQFDWPYFRAVGMQGQTDADISATLRGYDDADGFVFDSHPPGSAGGTGQTFGWERFPRLESQIGLLAGGLKPSNVALGIRATRCGGVDVCSGVEESPGIKSPRLMREFVQAARIAGAAIEGFK